MNVIFTCGGTAGHINPALSVAKLLKEKKPDANILFVGAEGGMETRLVPREGFALKTLKISSYSRKLTPSGIWHNFVTLHNLRGALRNADRIGNWRIRLLSHAASRGKARDSHGCPRGKRNARSDHPDGGGYRHPDPGLL